MTFLYKRKNVFNFLQYLRLHAISITHHFLHRSPWNIPRACQTFQNHQISWNRKLTVYGTFNSRWIEAEVRRVSPLPQLWCNGGSIHRRKGEANNSDHRQHTCPSLFAHLHRDDVILKSIRPFFPSQIAKKYKNNHFTMTRVESTHSICVRHLCARRKTHEPYRWHSMIARKMEFFEEACVWRCHNRCYGNFGEANN